MSGSWIFSCKRRGTFWAFKSLCLMNSFLMPFSAKHCCKCLITILALGSLVRAIHKCTEVLKRSKFNAFAKDMTRHLERCGLDDTETHMQRLGTWQYTKGSCFMTMWLKNSISVMEQSSDWLKNSLSEMKQSLWLVENVCTRDGTISLWFNPRFSHLVPQMW